MSKTLTATMEPSVMRVVVVYGESSQPRELRQIVHGAGLTCEIEDCVHYDDLAGRLAGGNVDLLVICLDQESTAGMRSIQEANALSTAPVLAIGAADNSEIVQQARRAGAIYFVSETNLRNELDETLDKISSGADQPRRRGNVYAVFAPVPGSGGTTVAANLAGALAQTDPQQVALVELDHRQGDVALLLDVSPKFTLDDVCRRWKRLDATSMRHSMTEHKSGLHVLAPAPDPLEESALSPEAVRRIGVLSRSLYDHTVLALESLLSDADIEAMKLADSVVLVVRPDVPGLRRVQSALNRAVERGVPRDRFRMVINRAGQGGELKARQIEPTLGLDVFQSIPDDPSRCNKAANQGMLLVELARRSTICRRFSALAKSLAARQLVR